MNYTQLWKLVEAQRPHLLSFAQRLVQTPSMSGQEAAVASLIKAEMERLGYDQVWMDPAGNVIGHIQGSDAPSLMLNGHIDHVAAGDPDHWRHPPFGGEIHQGELWGRGAADMKGAVAAMVYAGAVLKELGQPLPGDLYVSAVVQEEVGGLGARHLARTLPIARIIVGEASGNHLRRGHRGRVELRARFEGRSVHASMPDLGINPHYSMAPFLAGLQALEMISDPEYGASTVAPTRIMSEPESANVTPSGLEVVLDWRNIPGELPEDIIARLDALLARSLEPGCQGRIQIATKELVSHTGFPMTYPANSPSFTTSADHPWLARVHDLLCAALGREVEIGVWRFATDGGHFAAAGATVLGFGPGSDAVVHTVEERVPVDQLVESLVGYAALVFA